MSDFFLPKKFSQPGDTMTIQGSCIAGHTQFSSSDESVAIVSPPTTVNVVGIGTAKIYESTPYLDCSNSSTGVVLTSTEDGKPFFMSVDDYTAFTNYEGIFVFFLLLSAFLIRFAKKT